MIYKKISDELNISEEQIEAICTSMHKTTEEERHMNCRMCGFNRCEQMVAAIFLGIRKKEECVQYSQLKILPKNLNMDMMAKLLSLFAMCNKTIIDLKKNKKIYEESIEILIKREKKWRVLFFQTQHTSTNAEMEINELLDRLRILGKSIDNLEKTKRLIIVCVKNVLQK